MLISRNPTTSPGQYTGDAASALNFLDADRSTGFRPPNEGEDDGGGTGAGGGGTGQGAYSGRFDSLLARASDPAYAHSQVMEVAYSNDPLPTATPRSTAIADGWAAYKYDPQRVMRAMTDNDVSAIELASATGQTLQAVADYLRLNGAPPGFAGVNLAASSSTNSRADAIAAGWAVVQS